LISLIESEQFNDSCQTINRRNSCFGLVWNIAEPQIVRNYLLYQRSYTAPVHALGRRIKIVTAQSRSIFVIYPLKDSRRSFQRDSSELALQILGNEEEPAVSGASLSFIIAACVIALACIAINASTNMLSINDERTEFYAST